MKIRIKYKPNFKNYGFYTHKMYTLVVINCPNPYSQFLYLNCRGPVKVCRLGWVILGAVLLWSIDISPVK